MSYNLGMILSMILVIAFFLLGGDMIALSYCYSNLDSSAITIGYIIAKEGRVNDDIITRIEETYHVTFENISPKNPSVGDIVDFVICRYYDPLIMSTEPIKLEASRSTVVGYYG